jgi:hypothetical protein
VAPGGLLLLSEPAMSDGMVAGSPDPPHLVRRTMSTYRTLLAGCGLTLVAVAPATIILNEPIAARSRSAFRRWQHVWGLTWRIQRFDRLLWLLAPTLNTVDTLLCRLLRRSPVSQLLLLARQPG